MSAQRTFKVWVVGRKRPITIKAGYCKIDEAGNLGFRTWQGGERYPVLHAIIAAGHWREVRPQ